MKVDISCAMREEIIEHIYDLIEETNEMYDWENKLPDLKNHTTLMLLNYYHNLMNFLL